MAWGFFPEYILEYFGIKWTSIETDNFKSNIVGRKLDKSLWASINPEPLYTVGGLTVIKLLTIEEFSSKIKQIHFWYFWEKQVSLMEFIHMSMGKQNLDLKKKMHLRELSGSKFHSVTSSNVILYNDIKNSISSKVDLSGFGTDFFNFKSYIVGRK